jgi:hypothetical protein
VPLNHYTRQVIAAVALFAGTAGTFSARAQSGRAIDYYTHEPIVGAHMVLDCQADPWTRPEGRVHLRSVSRTTDEQGRYSFSFADRLGCSYLHLFGEKAGYSGSFGNEAAESLEHSVPTIQYFIKTSDTVWFELQSISPSSAGVRNLDGSESIAGTYEEWFRAFFEAKRIATAPRETAFVHEHYCAKLGQLYAKLSDADKESLMKYVVQFSFGGKSATGRVLDYPAEVEPYCASP